MADRASNMPQPEYILGHSEREIRRLMQQAAILRPTTERLLRGAGIGRGMRVLDLGCGAGDVSMLAAELVGASGSVVGIDRSQEVIAVARERARTAKLGHVDFREVSVEAFSDPEPFDAVIGRYVLIHQADPVALIRAAAGLVRPGGVMAFQELCVHGQYLQSIPSVSLWQQAGEWIQMALQSVAPHYDAGGRLIEYFSRAGLPQPTLFCESPVGGGKDSPLCPWVADTLASFMPQLLRMGMATADTIAIDTFKDRLRTAVVETHSQIVGPAQFCAGTWV
ncbi:MAG: class I SAM-dependent methyltransferase [Planctomycetaceae bacterium]|nr:class I SAM-dependent methyltransferase [Planctomycetaceae bacterium]